MQLSCTTAIVKDQLCILLVQQLQQQLRFQYSKDQHRFIKCKQSRDKTSKDKEHGKTKRQSCFCCKAKPAHPRSQCPAKDVTCHKCGTEGHCKKCCKSKTGKRDTIGETWQVQVHGLQTPLTGANANQTSVSDPAQDYHMMFSL